MITVKRALKLFQSEKYDVERVQLFVRWNKGKNARPVTGIELDAELGRCYIDVAIDEPEGEDVRSDDPWPV